MSKEQQRGRKERFIVIPFSSTCRSASSVDVVQSNKPQPQGAGGRGEVTSAAPAVVGKPAKPESLSLVARLLRGFKNLSHQIFAVYDDEDEEEEEEQEMVIGLPTDVKHVAHIGWDGSTSTTTSLRSWNRAAPPPAPDAASTSSSSSSAAAPAPQSQAQEPALSVRQFELAMAAQATAAAGAAASTSGSGSGAGSSTAQRRHRHYS